MRMQPPNFPYAGLHEKVNTSEVSSGSVDVTNPGHLLTLLYDPQHQGTTVKSPHNPDGGVYAIFVTSVLALVGNTICLALIFVVPKLRRPSNAFFIHQCVLDVIKSAYSLVFIESLLKGSEPPFCRLLGTTYIVFVTATAFNTLAVVVNELYSFASRAAGVEHKNHCCTLFGVAVTWFASVIINLGIAFLPTHTSFERSMGYCTFMYGVTGNYLLHLLWIGLVTLALLMTAFYLRKLHLDVKTKAFHKVFSLFRKTMRLNIKDTPGNKKAALIKRNLEVTVRRAYRNFIILVGMVCTFVAFWYPLFVLTAVDYGFRVNRSVYRALTLITWSHSLTTPIFFILYNTSKLQKGFRDIVQRKNRSSSGTPAQSPTSSGSKGSPTRPNYLGVSQTYSQASMDNIQRHSYTMDASAESSRRRSHPHFRRHSLSLDTQEIAAANEQRQKRLARRHTTVLTRLAVVAEGDPIYDGCRNMTRQRYSIPITELEQAALTKGRIKGNELRKLSISHTCPARIVERLGMNDSADSIDSNESFTAELHVHTMENFGHCKKHHKRSANGPPMARSRTVGDTLGGEEIGVEEGDDKDKNAPLLTVHRMSTGCIVTTKLHRQRLAGRAMADSGIGGQNSASVVYWV